MLTATSLVVILYLALARKLVQTPADWLYLQLNGVLSRNYATTVGVIREALRSSVYPVGQILQDLLSLWMKVCPQRLILAMDEANVLVSLYPNTFKPATNPNSIDRPLWTCLARHVAPDSQPDFALIIAGTAIGLRSLSTIITAVAKTSPTELQGLELDEYTFP